MSTMYLLHIHEHRYDSNCQNGEILLAYKNVESAMQAAMNKMACCKKDLTGEWTAGYLALEKRPILSVHGAASDYYIEITIYSPIVMMED